jgi:hypothetical protein
MAMERSPFLPLPDGLVLGQAEIGEAQLTVEVISQPSHAPAVLAAKLSQMRSTVSINEAFMMSRVQAVE